MDTNNPSQSTPNEGGSTETSNDQINRFVILQFGEGSQQDVIIDYRDNIRNAIVEQRRRQQSLSNSRPPSSATTLLAEGDQPSQTSQESLTVENNGIPGIDFPAFDVTSEGVYGANRTSSRLLDLLTPGIATPSNTGATVSPTTEPVQQTTANLEANTSGAANSNRNIILTVNYEYSSAADQEEARDRSASLVLNVPNVPQGEDENRLQALIRFATIILFRTIAMSLQNKQRGISEEQFGKLPVKLLTDIKERSCPICYDEFEEVSKKRKREEEEEEEVNSVSKSQKSTTSEMKPTSDSQKQEVKPSVPVHYSHIPIEMPCKHIFGQDCLHEWLKLNNSCPLCRFKIYEENRNNDGVQTTTMNLPNLARFLNDNSRDSLLNGEINRLPMLVVSNDSDPSDAAESLNNDLRNNLNNVPIIVTTTPTTIPTLGGGGVLGAAPAGLSQSTSGVGVAAAAGGWNRFTRENIVRRIINSLTNSIGSNYSATPVGPIVGGALAFPPLGSGHQLHERRIRAIRRSHMSSSPPPPPPPGSSVSEFVNRDPLFPVGVSSRRTANGVETVNIDGGSNRERPTSEDYLIQESIVNDLLYGTPRRNNNPASDNSSSTNETNNDNNESSTNNS